MIRLRAKASLINSLELLQQLLLVRLEGVTNAHLSIKRNNNMYAFAVMSVVYPFLYFSEIRCMPSSISPSFASEEIMMHVNILILYALFALQMKKLRF